MIQLIDPWSSAIVDYEKLIEQFGIKPFSDLLDDVENPPNLIKEGLFLVIEIMEE